MLIAINTHNANIDNLNSNNNATSLLTQEMLGMLNTPIHYSNASTLYAHCVKGRLRATLHKRLTNNTVEKSTVLQLRGAARYLEP